MSLSRKVQIGATEQLKNDIFKFTIQSEEMAKMALPGQFLEIRVNDDIEPFLRRPISRQAKKRIGVYFPSKRKRNGNFIKQKSGG